MVELITIFITLLPGNMTLHEERTISPIESNISGIGDVEFCKDYIIPDILLKHKDSPDRKLLSVRCEHVLEDKDRT